MNSQTLLVRSDSPANFDLNTAVQKGNVVIVKQRLFYKTACCKVGMSYIVT